jgi:CheY-like chemotaxis protein
VAKGRVVIADDSVTLRRLLRAILENMGLAVVGEAGDGQQAIDIALREKPDLVCLDVEMPVLDGLSALARLRTLAPALPVIMITSLSDRETVQQAAKSGARGYIVKPYQPEKVELAIRKLLNL